MLKGYLAVGGIYSSFGPPVAVYTPCCFSSIPCNAIQPCERTNPSIATIFRSNVFMLIKMRRWLYTSGHSIIMLFLRFITAPGKIVAGAVIQEVYRSAVLEFGLWQQIRVDPKEFYVIGLLRSGKLMCSKHCMVLRRNNRECRPQLVARNLNIYRQQLGILSAFSYLSYRMQVPPTINKLLSQFI